MRLMRLVVLLLVLMTGYVQCSKDHDPDPRDKKIGMLTAIAWVTDNVQNSSDGDLTFQYTNFTIVFVSNDDETFDGDYYLTGGGTAFSELAGKWKFNDDLTKIILATGREMDVTLTDDSLTLSFDIPSSEGRSAGLSGHFTFNLKKN
jgi:hypothetical protein